MKIYTVYEECRGMGEMGIASYFNEKEATTHSLKSSHFYVLETEITIQHLCKTCYYKNSCQEDKWDDNDFIVSECGVYEADNGK